MSSSPTETSTPRKESSPSPKASPVPTELDEEEIARRYCATRPKDTPGILHTDFTGKNPDEDSWTFEQARAALRRAGLDPDDALPQGESQWGSGVEVAVVPGETGELVAAARRLEAQDAPDRRLEPPGADVFCDGRPDLQGYFSVWLPKKVDVRDVVRRHGNKEDADGEPIETADGATLIWFLAPEDPDVLVRRALLYFEDRDVLFVELGFGIVRPF